MATVLKAAGSPTAYAFEMAYNPDTAEYTLTVTQRSRTSDGNKYLTQSVTDTSPPDGDLLIYTAHNAMIAKLHTEGYTIEGDVLT